MLLGPTPITDSNGKTTGFGYTDSDKIDELKSLAVKFYKKGDIHYQTVSIYMNADGSTKTMSLNETLTTLIEGGYDFNSIMDAESMFQFYKDYIKGMSISDLINNNVNVFDLATFDFKKVLTDFDYNTIFDYINMTTVYNGLNLASDAALENNRLIFDYKVPDGDLDNCYFLFILTEQDGTDSSPIYETGSTHGSKKIACKNFGPGSTSVGFEGPGNYTISYTITDIKPSKMEIDTSSTDVVERDYYDTCFINLWDCWIGLCFFCDLSNVKQKYYSYYEKVDLTFAQKWQ